MNFCRGLVGTVFALCLPIFIFLDTTEFLGPIILSPRLLSLLTYIILIVLCVVGVVLLFPETVDTKKESS